MRNTHTHTRGKVSFEVSLNVCLALSFTGCENTARIFGFAQPQFNDQQNGWDHTLFIIL